MGWLRLIGSLKLQVSFAKEPYKRDLYSAKETYNFKELTNCSHPITTSRFVCGREEVGERVWRERKRGRDCGPVDGVCCVSERVSVRESVCECVCERECVRERV